LGFKDVPQAGVSFKYLEGEKAAHEQLERLKLQKTAGRN